MTRVAVIGAAGRMGQEVCAAVRAEPDLELAAMVDISYVGDVAAFEAPAGDTLSLLEQSGAEVAVDFTKAEAAIENTKWCVEHGVYVVIGTSGISPEAQSEIAALCEEHAGHVLIAPNFAIGGVLAMKFAEMAAAWMPDAEVIELHHSGKVDSPSGTAINTVDAILRGRRSPGLARPGALTETLPGARGASKYGVHVHSVRLPGLVAHQEVLFGGPGQILTIRHDSMDRKSFMPGVIIAVREIAAHPGLTVGLDKYLGL